MSATTSDCQIFGLSELEGHRSLLFAMPRYEIFLKLPCSTSASFLSPSKSTSEYPIKSNSFEKGYNNPRFDDSIRYHMIRFTAVDAIL